MKWKCNRVGFIIINLIIKRNEIISSFLGSLLVSPVERHLMAHKRDEFFDELFTVSAPAKAANECIPPCFTEDSLLVSSGWIYFTKCYRSYSWDTHKTFPLSKSMTPSS